MSNTLNDLKQFKTEVWCILFFLFLARLSLFVSIPYLAFYLTSIHYSNITTGMIVASQPLAYSAFSLIGGYFADRYGKKNIMIISFLMTAVASIFYDYADSIFSFLIISISYGIARSLFDAAMPAYFTDIVPEKLHRFAFNFRFMVINAAAAIGPLIGVYFANRHPLMVFNISGVIFFLCGIGMLWLLPKEKSAIQKNVVEFNFRKTLQVMAKEKALLYLVLGMLVYWMVYIQLEAPFAQALVMRSPAHATWLFGLLWVINGVLIVTLQIPLSTMTRQWSLRMLTYVGTLLISAAFIGFALFTHLFAYVVCAVLLTFGEMLLSPISNIVVAKIAPEEYRATYFGALSLAFMGIGFGPLLGGFILQYFNPEVLFLCAVVLLQAVIFCYRRSLA